MIENTFHTYWQRPIKIRAIYWDGRRETFETVKQFIIEEKVECKVSFHEDGVILLKRPYGDLLVQPKAFICAGDFRDIFICGVNAFQHSFEKVSDL